MPVSYFSIELADGIECVYISSLALLKMLKHGRAGVPMEVMGLMLGEFVDDYTVQYVSHLSKLIIVLLMFSQCRRVVQVFRSKL